MSDKRVKSPDAAATIAGDVSRSFGASMRRTYQVPETMFTHLVGSMVKETAHFMLRNRQADDILQPPDPFGLVLEWMWGTDPDRAVRMVADLLAQLRYHDEIADRSITLDDLVYGLPQAIPALPAGDTDALLDRVVAEVPQFFSKNVNT